MGEFTELRELLERAIIDAPPVLVRDGGVIAPGYNEELDEWRALADGATDYLDKLEIRERERLGLDTLKVGYNAVHGYYIQISRGQSHGPDSLRSPPDAEKCRALHYTRAERVRRQSAHVEGKALALEKQLYDELFDILMPHG